MADISAISGTITSSFDGISIFYRGWIHPAPVGYVYIMHGMSEHSDRYKDFAIGLAKSLQVSVFATDHRAHGRTACPDGKSDLQNLGVFQTTKPLSSVNCLEVMARDLLDLIGLNESQKSLPLVLFGHSMGSLIARWVVRTFPSSNSSQLRGVVLSGVPTVPALHERGPLLILLNMCLSLNKGRDKLHRFIMDKFDDKVRRDSKNPKLGRSCFISSVVTELENFESDSLCGQTVDLYLWKSLRSTLIELMDPKKFLGDTKVPFAFISGRNDPICDYGKTASEDAKKMSHPVTEIYLSNCLHEFIHEETRVREEGINLLHGVRFVDETKSKL